MIMMMQSLSHLVQANTTMLFDPLLGAHFREGADIISLSMSMLEIHCKELLSS